MKIPASNFTRDIQQRIFPIYVLLGEEPLQLQEISDAIRHKARVEGYTDRELFHIDTSFDGSLLRTALFTLSLFDASKIVELRFKNKPDKKTIQLLQEFLQSPPGNLLLLIFIPKLTSTEQKQAWIQSIDQIGLIVQVWPIEGDRLISWIDKRLASRGLLADQSGLRILASRVEGNLLAAAQEIEKLSILHGKKNLSDADILRSVADSSRFDVFDLTDSLLQGHAIRSFRILSTLKGEGIASPVLIWAIARDLRILHELSQSEDSRNGQNTIFARHRIWDTRKSLLERALKRLDSQAIRKALTQAAKVDRIAKGQCAGDEWQALWNLCECVIAPKSALPQQTL